MTKSRSSFFLVLILITLGLSAVGCGGQREFTDDEVKSAKETNILGVPILEENPLPGLTQAPEDLDPLEATSGELIYQGQRFRTTLDGESYTAATVAWRFIYYGSSSEKDSKSNSLMTATEIDLKLKDESLLSIEVWGKEEGQREKVLQALEAALKTQ